MYGYSGDGTVHLGDFALGGLVGAATIGVGDSQTLTFDVTGFVAGLVANHQTFAGFNVREEPANVPNFLVMRLDPPDAAMLSIHLSPDTGGFWVGLRNSDDIGTAFDIAVELHRNGMMVASGLTRCVKGLGRNPREVFVEFDPFDPVPVDPGDVLALKVLTRIGTNPDGTRCTGVGAGHTSAVGLRLYYDSANRDSHFNVTTTTPGPGRDLFLHSDGGACPGGGGQSIGVTTLSLDDIAPAALRARCKDSGNVGFSGGNPFRVIGTWSMTQP